MNSKKIPTLKSSPLRVGISMGDPSGIGAAIILKAANRLKGLADFVIIGDRGVFKQLSVVSGQWSDSDIVFLDLKNINHKNFKFGEINAKYGRASIEYLNKAVELLENKEIDCLVTCPISKEAVNLAGIKFTGHTEYLARRFDVKETVMMLLNRYLKISLLTRHIPLAKVSSLLTEDRLAKTIFITYEYLKKIFLIRYPRIVVCGLNPHASDNGLIGSQENKVIKPVIKKLNKRLCVIDGPLASDVALVMAVQNKYDCVIAMYHDQALIPLKLLGNSTGVNITLGLPFIRTSPLHGTAFDIAKSPSSADPTSLIESIKLAVRCALRLKSGI